MAFPKLLLTGYVVLFLALGYAPYDRGTWWAENIPVLLIVAALAATYRKFRFSNAAYVWMAFFLTLHTIGGHYTFERVPFGWVSSLFGFERNHFDRVAHFCVGFFAFPICEYLEAKGLTTRRWVTACFAVFAIFTVAAVYEIIEWWYAAAADPAAGAAFLGSQGDIWDAQRDMLADGLGAILTATIYHLSSLRESRSDSKQPSQ
jgi:putative membrane protein